MNERELGRVEYADIMIEDHGIMTFAIGFDFGGSHQAFANYALDTWDEEKKRRVGTAFGCDVILRLMKVFRVDRFSEIVGKVAYVIRDDGVNPMIRGIEATPFDGGQKLMIKEVGEEWELPK